jgi:hypothetical protein
LNMAKQKGAVRNKKSAPSGTCADSGLVPIAGIELATYAKQRQGIWGTITENLPRIYLKNSLTDLLLS